MNGADIQERRRTLSAQLAEMSVGEIKRNRDNNQS